MRTNKKGGLDVRVEGGRDSSKQKALATSWKSTRDIFDPNVNGKKSATDRITSSPLHFHHSTHEDEVRPRPIEDTKNKGNNGESEQARTQSLQQTARERQHHRRTRCRGTFHSLVRSRRTLLAKTQESQHRQRTHNGPPNIVQHQLAGSRGGRILKTTTLYSRICREFRRRRF